MTDREQLLLDQLAVYVDWCPLGCKVQSSACPEEPLLRRVDLNDRVIFYLSPNLYAAWVERNRL
jgi:hypothetical protein